MHAGSNPFLDAIGSCVLELSVSLLGARSKAQLHHARASAAKEAGLNCKLEPDTSSLLLDDFSQENCKRMFPKQASKLYSERVNAVVNAVELISSPSCTFSDAEKRSYVQVRIDALPVIPKEDAVGLRIDLELEDPATGETKWVDATVVHTAAESYREREFKAVMARNVSASTAAALGTPDVLKFWSALWQKLRSTLDLFGLRGSKLSRRSDDKLLCSMPSVCQTPANYPLQHLLCSTGWLINAGV